MGTTYANEKLIFKTLFQGQINGKESFQVWIFKSSLKEGAG